MILHDQHIHSSFSEDSHASISNYVKRALREGKEYFITCEHVDFFPPCQPKTWLADFKKLRKKCEELSKTYNIKFLYGIELGCRLDHIDLMNKVLNENKFDLVQLSMHDDGVNDFYRAWAFNNVKESVNHYLDCCIDAVTNFDNFDVLSHFDYGIKTAIKAHGLFDIRMFEDKLKTLFSIIIKKDKVLEINTKVQSTINSDEYLKYILSLYKSLGGKHISMSSDAHQVRNYCYKFDHYMPIIKDAGFDHLCYFIDRKRYYFSIKA